MSGVDAALAAATAAAPQLEPASPRIRLLCGVADALDAASDQLVAIAERETGLPTARLSGEVLRTSFQLRLMADVVADGSVFDARIDHPDPDWPPGARPDLRRASLPLGPVVVFAASNFPFAFSVAGGDTAAAWAAGCPVVLKAHPGHLELSRRVAELIAAVASAIAPGALTLIESEEDGRAAVVHPLIRAGAFTGSLAAGRALFDLAASRPDPIPFYAEMGSINPVFVTPSAAAARAETIANGFGASFTLGSGQFCTKPGLLLVPESFDLGLLAAAARAQTVGRMLHGRIADAFASSLQMLTATDGIELLVSGERDGLLFAPTLVRCSAASLDAGRDVLLAEHFGPVSVVATYSSGEELLALAGQLDGQLTATIHAEAGDELAPRLLEALRDRAGRLLYNGWPTGVSVSWAMQHGGPYPATTAAATTSVGTAAVERFVRPVCFQNVPDELLPAPLREANPWGIVRRVDGRLVGTEASR